MALLSGSLNTLGRHPLFFRKVSVPPCCSDTQLVSRKSWTKSCNCGSRAFSCNLRQFQQNLKLASIQEITYPSLVWQIVFVFCPTFWKMEFWNYFLKCWAFLFWSSLPREPGIFSLPGLAQAGLILEGVRGFLKKQRDLKYETMTSGLKPSLRWLLIFFPAPTNFDLESVFFFLSYPIYFK